MTSAERFGKYELVSKIADGGMAEVFLAVVEGMAGFKKRVALKRILPSYSRDASFVHSFVNEARICGQLVHNQNIVQVYEFDRIDDYLYLAMEFIEGLDLERIITHRLLRRKLIPPSIAAEIVLQMLDGLGYAHEARSFDDEPLNVVHRDLKPSNVLIDRSGIIKIVDFGVAKSSSNVYKTMNVGTAKGTVSYMSPEQASGRTDLGPPSDLFGVGSILYELLTLRRLFDGENLFVILDEVRTAPLDERLARLPEVPDGLVHVLTKALARELTVRYASAAEMARDLRAVFPDLQGTTLLARFVEELCDDGLTIAGFGESSETPARQGEAAESHLAAETRPGMYVPGARQDPLTNKRLSRASRNIANMADSDLEASSVRAETREDPADRPAMGAVLREALQTTPSESQETRRTDETPVVKMPRGPSPASVLRSSEQVIDAVPVPEEYERTPVTRGKAQVVPGLEAGPAEHPPGAAAAQTGAAQPAPAGATPLAQAGAAQPAPAGAALLAQADAAPLGQTGAGPLARSGAAPLGQTGAAPLAQSGAAPLGQTGAGPLAQSGAAPLGQTGVAQPAPAGVAAPAQSRPPVTGPRGPIPSSPSGPSAHPQARPMASRAGPAPRSPSGQAASVPAGHAASHPSRPAAAARARPVDVPERSPSHPPSGPASHSPSGPASHPPSGPAAHAPAGHAAPSSAATHAEDADEVTPVTRGKVKLPPSPAHQAPWERGESRPGGPASNQWATPQNAAPFPNSGERPQGIPDNRPHRGGAAQFPCPALQVSGGVRPNPSYPSGEPVPPRDGLRQSQPASAQPAGYPQGVAPHPQAVHAQPSSSVTSADMGGVPYRESVSRDYQPPMEPTAWEASAPYGTDDNRNALPNPLRSIPEIDLSQGMPGYLPSPSDAYRPPGPEAGGQEETAWKESLEESSQPFVSPWQLETEQMVVPPDWMKPGPPLANAGWDTGVAADGAAAGESLSGPVADSQVKNLLSDPPEWKEEEEQKRPFGAPLERVMPLAPPSKEKVLARRKKRTRALWNLLLLELLLLAGIFFWTYTGRQPAIRDLLLPPPKSRVTFVVNNVPTWGELRFLGDPQPVRKPDPEAEKRGGAVFEVELNGKKGYEMWAEGPGAKSAEPPQAIVIDPDNPATWKINANLIKQTKPSRK